MIPLSNGTTVEMLEAYEADPRWWKVNSPYAMEAWARLHNAFRGEQDAKTVTVYIDPSYVFFTRDGRNYSLPSSYAYANDPRGLALQMTVYELRTGPGGFIQAFLRMVNRTKLQSASKFVEPTTLVNGDSFLASNTSSILTKTETVTNGAFSAKAGNLIGTPYNSKGHLAYQKVTITPEQNSPTNFSLKADPTTDGSVATTTTMDSNVSPSVDSEYPVNYSMTIIHFGVMPPVRTGEPRQFSAHGFHYDDVPNPDVVSGPMITGASIASNATVTHSAGVIRTFAETDNAIGRMASIICYAGLIRPNVNYERIAQFMVDSE